MNLTRPIDETQTLKPAFDQLLKERHSCRGFLPEPVPKEVIESALRMAQQTASWSNTQAWRVHLCSGAATKRLSAALLQALAAGDPGGSDIPWPTGFEAEYLDRRRACGHGLYQAVGVARGDKEGYARQHDENYRFFGAPHVAILTSPGFLGPYGAVDVGAYVQILMLSLQAHGVASIAQAALATHSELVKSQLGIGDDRTMVCGISFGYKDPKHPANSFRTSRAPLEEVVNWIHD